MNRASLILAGGASSRLWPLDGDRQPKFLLPVEGRTLLQHAVDRARALGDDVFVVTGEAQAELVQRALPSLGDDHLIVEPARRDTAAAVMTGARAIEAIDPDCAVLVMPADVLISPSEALAAGADVAAQQSNWREHIHVFAVEPTRNEGGFGYIETTTNDAVSSVSKFHEKPGDATAEDYVRREFLWNVGCFFFALPTFFDQAEQHLPTHSKRLHAVPVAEDYSSVESISIDFGLIEKADNLRAVRLAARFDDLGTWNALDRAGHLDALDGVRFDNELLTLDRTDDRMTVCVGARRLELVQQNGQWTEDSRSG